ncbi:hypothetical protein JOD55_000706 [Arcanobacterium pluranimalium]|uniref:hypothetical protein n=1 Tax=Arcanobacterium pluranimalium TaxID=108028 RepID=UPI00195C268B|nr:hypothetical protein [Arcanobacterium pluranimalium]MBM7824879.1 hypothetical protein [Arcanobacterium pluranimalium]
MPTEKLDRLHDLGKRFENNVVESRVGSYVRNSFSPRIADWFFAGAILVFSFFTFLYGDILATYEHSFNFLDALFSGHIRDFYQLAIDHNSFGHPAVYDFPIYLLFGLWNLPTYIIHHLTGFDYLQSIPALLWLKLGITLCVVLAARACVLLARDLGLSKDRSKWVGFFFLTSMTVVVPAFVIVQYDIIMVLVVLFGLRAYLADKNLSFVLWFMLANTLKLFSVFIFIPLLLLKIKKLRYVFGYLALGMAGIVFSRLLYAGDTAYKASTAGFSSGMLNRLTDVKLPWYPDSPYGIPLFVVAIILIAVFSYVKLINTKRELAVWTVYICCAVFLAFVCLVILNPYWAILVAPFLCVMTFLNRRYLLLNILLETGISTAVMVVYIFVGYPIYNRNILDRLVFGHVIEAPEKPRFGVPTQFLAAVGIDKTMVPFIVGFLFACVIAFLIVNFPSRILAQDVELQAEKEDRVPLSAIYFHMAVPLGFILMLLVIYIVPAKVPAYSATSEHPVPSASNLLEKNAQFTETFVPSRTINSRIVEIGIEASSVTWIDSSLIHFEIKDNTGQVLFAADTPANIIGTGALTVKTDGFVFEKGKSYLFSLSSAQTEGAAAYVLMNKQRDEFVSTENGVEVKGDWSIQIFE